MIYDSSPHATGTDNLSTTPAHSERLFVILSLIFFAGGAWFLLPISKDHSQFGGAPSDSTSQLLALIIFAGALLLLVRCWEDAVRVFRRDMFLWGIVVLAMYSWIWSAAPELTLRRSIALLGTALFALYFTTRFQLAEQVRLLTYSLSICLILSVVVVYANPGIGTDPDGNWRGIFPTKNALGRIVALTIVLYLIQSNPNWKTASLRIAGVLLGAYTLTSSDSKTAMVITIAFLLLIPLSRMLRIHYSISVIIYSATIVLSIFALNWFITNSDEAVIALGRDPTLTGRSELWSAVMSAINHHPWIGHGYSAFWQGWNGPSRDVWTAVDWEPPHSHSGFLDLWLELGAISIVLLVISWGRAFWRALALASKKSLALGAWPLLLLTFLILYNFTESAILRQNSLFTVLLISGFLSMEGNTDPAPNNSRAGPQNPYSEYQPAELCPRDQEVSPRVYITQE